MKPWELEQVRRATKSKWVQRGSRVFGGRVCTDSRQAKEGDLFIAIVGKNFDGHAFVRPVVEAGAAIVLVHRELPPEVIAAVQATGVTILQTDDTVAALNRLAAAYRAEIRAKVIAVGGSNGKTTTKRIIHTLLSEKLSGHASPKSFNNNIGMPLTLLEVEPSHEFVVLEIGTNAPGEIAALGEVARPDIAVITNIGLEHLERLGDLDGVAREEASIAPYVQPGGTLVLPADAPELLKALRLANAQRITVGRAGSGADLQAADITETMQGVTFTLNGRIGFRLPLLGEHNALNALLAIAVARRLGLNEEQIQSGLDKVRAAPMRLEMLHVGGRFIVNDAYNANPSSMAASLQTFSRLALPPGARRVAILGDMLELGAVSDAMHRQVGQWVASAKLPVFVAVGQAMQQAADAAEAAAGGALRVHRFPNAAAAAGDLPRLLNQGDVLLLKGSRGMKLETILEGLGTGQPHSARC